MNFLYIGHFLLNEYSIHLILFQWSVAYTGGSFYIVIDTVRVKNCKKGAVFVAVI